MSRARVWLGLTALAALGVCFIVLRTSTATPAGLRAEVRQAYLDWWDARRQAFLELDTSPERRYATAAGLQVDQARMAGLRQVSHLLRLAADHNLQIVVYAGATTTSVDDVWADHSVELDPITMSPIQPDPDQTVHESTTMRKVGGRWLVDAVWRFGVAHPAQGEQVSWVAFAGGQPLPESYSGPIAQAYLARAAAGLQHNYRVAIQQDSIAWVYDTAFGPTGVSHASTRLVQEGPGAWKVQADHQLRTGWSRCARPAAARSGAGPWPRRWSQPAAAAAG